MGPQEIWKLYVGEESPGAFMCQFRSRSPERCVKQHLSARGAVYGIARRGSWQDTFQASEQHSSESVMAALTAYLEETREEWQAAIEERERGERQERERLERERQEEPVDEVQGTGLAPAVQEPEAAASEPVASAGAVPPQEPAPSVPEPMAAQDVPSPDSFEGQAR